MLLLSTSGPDGPVCEFLEVSTQTGQEGILGKEESRVLISVLDLVTDRIERRVRKVRASRVQGRRDRG